MTAVWRIASYKLLLSSKSVRTEGEATLYQLSCHQLNGYIFTVLHNSTTTNFFLPPFLYLLSLVLSHRLIVSLTLYLPSFHYFSLRYRVLLQLILEPRYSRWYSDSVRARRSGVRISAGASDFFFSKTVQTGCGAHAACNSVGNIFIFRR
jgi:hypothetical protein